MKVKLTDALVRRLEPPSTGNRITYDTLVQGFGVRVTRAGARSFVLNYWFHGREKRVTIGAFPDWTVAAARQRARELRRLIDRGEDPAEPQERGELTFERLVHAYFQGPALTQRGSREYRRLLERDALPLWGDESAGRIERADVAGLIQRRASEAPIAANRLFEVLRRVFNWGIQEGLLKASPCALIRKPSQERSADRVLSAEEIAALWHALDAPCFTPRTRTALRMVLVTAQRPGEVCGMRWSEVSGDSWTVPASRSKNGLAHRVPLNGMAHGLLDSLDTTSEWVFPGGPGSESGHLHRNALAKALRRHFRCPGAPFTPHDLRRTAASHMASAGVPRLVIGRVLNHQEPGVTRIYDRYGYDREKREALEVWEARLRAILETKRTPG